MIVALDAGTSSVRALAFDGIGHAIAETEEQLPYSLETTPNGGATFPVEPLFDLTVRAIDGVVARLGDAAAGVAAVGRHSDHAGLLLGGHSLIARGNRASCGARFGRRLAADGLSPPFVLLAGQAALAAAN